MEARIWVLDLNTELTNQVSTILGKAGYDIKLLKGQAEVLESVAMIPPDLIVLVAPCADPSSWQVVRSLRDISDVPLLMIFATGTPDDSVQAFNLGVDECLIGWTSAGILTARVRALLRRAAHF